MSDHSENEIVYVDHAMRVVEPPDSRLFSTAEGNVWTNHLIPLWLAEDRGLV